MRDYAPDLLALSTRPSTTESRQLSALCRQLAPQHFQGLAFQASGFTASSREGQWARFPLTGEVGNVFLSKFIPCKGT